MAATTASRVDVAIPGTGPPAVDLLELVVGQLLADDHRDLVARGSGPPIRRGWRPRPTRRPRPCRSGSPPVQGRRRSTGRCPLRSRPPSLRRSTARGRSWDPRFPAGSRARARSRTDPARRCGRFRSRSTVKGQGPSMATGPSVGGAVVVGGGVDSDAVLVVAAGGEGDAAADEGEGRGCGDPGAGLAQDGAAGLVVDEAHVGVVGGTVDDVVPLVGGVDLVEGAEGISHRSWPPGRGRRWRAGSAVGGGPAPAGRGWWRGRWRAARPPRGR